MYTSSRDCDRRTVPMLAPAASSFSNSASLSPARQRIVRGPAPSASAAGPGAAGASGGPLSTSISQSSASLRTFAMLSANTTRP